MSFKSFWRNYFYFNRKERGGIQILLITCILLTLVLFFIPVLLPKKSFDYSPYEKEIAKLNEAQLRTKDSLEFQRKSYNKTSYNNSYDKKSSKNAGELFSFDPNTLHTEGWQKLGLSEKQAMVITRYTAKGGRFYKKEDLKKMMVITDQFYQRIEPYIFIENNNLGNKDSKSEIELKMINKSIVSINKADSLELLSVNGIGEKLASRIIKYRDRLGGFYAIAQLKEVYGIKEDNFELLQTQLRVDKDEIITININYCGWNELSAHPYIGKAKASSIINYRNKNGTFKSVDDLLEFELIDTLSFHKVKPYLLVK